MNDIEQFAWEYVGLVASATDSDERSLVFNAFMAGYTRRPTPEPQGEAVFYAHADTIEVMQRSPPGKGKSRQTFITSDPGMWDGNATPLYTRPQPGEGGGEVTDEMVNRALDAQPYIDQKDLIRAWQCIGGDSKHAERLMRAALTAALAKGGQGG